jgi:putative hydrolase of the HAD superfamily
MIKLIVFDLDDTLYNELDYVKEGFRNVCRFISSKFGIQYDLLFNDCMEVLGREGRGKIFDLLCENYSINEDISNLVRIYRNTVPKLNLYEDAEEILRKLKGKYKLGIITDGMAAVQWKKINALNLEDVIDKIIVTDDLGRDYWKPNKHCFQEMLRHYSATGKEAVYVGDNPNKDFIGAKEAGFFTVRIIREIGDYMKLSVDEISDGHCKIHDLRELVNII